jgi:RNA polymerase sigma-70 factor (ECF subfamily)
VSDNSDPGSPGSVTLEAVQPSLALVPKKPVSRFPYDRLGDAELVQAVVQGDTEAVGVVWDRYSPLVRSVLRTNLGFDGDLEDLLQEVFLVFLRNAREIRSQGALRAFLVTVAVRVVLVELRRRRVRRWVALSPDGEVPETPARPQDVDGAAALNALYRLLEHIPERRRVAFTLRHIEGLDIGDVALALKVSESTAKREIARARRAIFKRAEHAEPALWHYLSQFSGGGDV